MSEPSYIELYEKDELQNRTRRALDMMSPCRLCPRECGVDRKSDSKTGFCTTGRNAVIASHGPHFGEEQPLVGQNGSGTIFFSSCNLLCSFCQNYDISHGGKGAETGPDSLASMMLDLARRGCHNINLVTPTHVVPQILEALPIAIEQGLDVPLVYNTGGYDSVETLKLLDGIVDIYMPDFKFWESQWGQRYCDAENYASVACAALREMHRQVGDLATDSDGIAVRGLLVRHLVMPDNIAGTANVMRFLADEISPDTFVNVMAQYRPCGTADKDAYACRRPTLDEYKAAVASARAAGLTRIDSSQSMFLG